MAERFTETLRRSASRIFEAQHQHPFVRGIGDGSLSLEQFQYWMRQDYVFLVEYSRVLALAATRSPELQTMIRFAALLEETLTTEMDLHRAYAAEFGIATSELEAEQMSPTTQAYTSFLLRVAALSDYGELVAALLPCMWGFSEIGQRLAQSTGSADNRYAKWIDMYASTEFANLAQWCRDLMDDVAAHAPEESRKRFEAAFLTSIRYEWQFWEMAWNLERWPV